MVDKSSDESRPLERNVKLRRAGARCHVSDSGCRWSIFIRSGRRIGRNTEGTQRQMRELATIRYASRWPSSWSAAEA